MTTAELTKVRDYLCRLAKSVTRANSFQHIRRDRKDGEIEYQIFADTDQPEDGCQIAWVQSTRHGAEFIAAVLAQAPLFEQLLTAAPVLPAPEPPQPAPHRCSGCGHRWMDSQHGFVLRGAELCGDCWRKAQPIVHASEGR